MASQSINNLVINWLFSYSEKYFCIKTAPLTDFKNTCYSSKIVQNRATPINQRKINIWKFILATLPLISPPYLFSLFFSPSSLLSLLSTSTSFWSSAPLSTFLLLYWQHTTRLPSRKSSHYLSISIFYPVPLRKSSLILQIPSCQDRFWIQCCSQDDLIFSKI